MKRHTSKSYWDRGKKTTKLPIPEINIDIDYLMMKCIENNINDSVLNCDNFLEKVKLKTPGIIVSYQL